MRSVRQRCKNCRHWGEKGRKIVDVEGTKTLFRPCRCPAIDGLRKKKQTSATRAIAMSLAIHPLVTHAKFGCNLWEKKPL